MTAMFSSAPLSAGLLGGMQLLLDLALKSVIVMLAAWAAVTLLRRASAATRHWVWGAAVISLLALPVLTAVLPSWQLGLLPSPVRQKTAESSVGAVAGGELPNPALEIPASAAAAEQTGQPPTTVVTPTSRPLRFDFDSNPTPPATVPGRDWIAVPSFVWSLDWGVTALAFWLLGAALVMVRLLTGTLRIWRLAKRAAGVTEGAWVSLSRNIAAQLGLRSQVELRKSQQVRLPMTWGAWRSVVMLPADADEWPHECRSIVLLHELAHIKRRDCLTQNLAQLACALYWFNPLVWLAAKQLHVERELACDDQVLEVGTKASEYATHLVAIARSFSTGSTGRELSLVAVGMACSQLESRVRSILDPGVRRRGLNRLTASLIGLGAICLIGSLAVAQPWSKTAASPRQAVAVIDQSLVNGTERESTALALGAESQALSIPQGEPHKEGSDTENSLREAQKRPGQEADEQDNDADDQDSAQSGNSKGLSTSLTADQIIEMKSAGVTPEFIDAMRKQGFENLTPKELTELSIHGVNAEYIKQARSWGGDKLTVRDIVNLKISGVTPEYISAMKQAGYDGLTARQLTELRIHGVTSEFVETMRRLGYDKLTANQLASLKIHGVDEAFVKEMQNWTGGKPTVNELMQIRIHGVTPDFARRMKAIGYDNLSLNKLTEMRIHGVDEQFVKEMRELGFDNLTVDQLIKMKIHGVTPEYVKKMRAAGLKNVSVNQMIEMKITGIDAILLKEKR